MRIFRTVGGLNPKGNKFDLSHEVKTSFNMGKLIPVLHQEVLPGDRYRISTECLIRMQPMLAPVIHRMNVSVHYFFVPNRLIWNEWEDFITGGPDGDLVPVHPRIKLQESTKNYFTKGKLNDYFGIAVYKTGTITNAIPINALPFRAYQEIYNEYYRDQNLEDPINYTKDSGLITDLLEIGYLTEVRTRAWQKDYFTSALPWTQRGGEVTMPMDVNLKAIAQFKDNTGADYSGGNVKTFEHGTTGQFRDTTDNVYGNLETIESIEATINNLRSAATLQQWLERNARIGSRYIEQILGHFGVMSSDKRLQRPEYLGGGVQPIVISEVLNTSGTPTEEQGYMAGHGISVGSTNQIQKSFEEHGHIIGIMSVIPKTAYCQGVTKPFYKVDKYDYYFPEFANLGEQSIQDLEIYWDGTSEHYGDFGYQSRYAEYKFQHDKVCGDFRDNLSFWHLARLFTVRPQLTGNFMQCQPSTRIFAVESPDYHKLYGQVYHKISAIRKIPYFSTPGINRI